MIDWCVTVRLDTTTPQTPLLIDGMRNISATKLAPDNPYLCAYFSLVYYEDYLIG